MPYPSILAFVEGRMERLFFNNNFHYITVVPVSNGISWTTDALAKQISTFYRARNFHGDAILVWVDREKRQESAQVIYNVIHDELVNSGANPNAIHIMVADRMSENVILSDEFLMRDELSDEQYAYSYEGAHGKPRLSELLSKSGITYKETSIGVQLLKRVRLAECTQTSPAVARLMATLQIPCWWLQPRI